MLGLLLAFSPGCKKDKDGQVPVISTIVISDTTYTTAKSGGNISSDDGSSVIARGLCWATTPDPTTHNDTTIHGKGIGIFTGTIKGLTPATLYYVRAYAINSAGVGYGETKSFKTRSLQVPALTTTAISDTSLTSATSGGKITSDGGSLVIANGVCWSTNQNPTIHENKTTNGTGPLNFTSNITGLEVSTTYYVRAYATNSSGTGYGNTLSFKTKSQITDIDGNVYHTVIIGTQVWMLENLNTTHYRNGDLIPNITDGYTWQYMTSGAYCNYNNYAPNAVTYGRMYNWYAISDSRNICPVGFHVPSQAEWQTLLNYLGDASTVGGKLKSTSNLWISVNVGATNSSGFAALPGGYRRIVLGGETEYGKFANLGATAYFWSSENFDTNNAISFYINYNASGILTAQNNKISGYSVRCIHD